MATSFYTLTVHTSIMIWTQNKYSYVSLAPALKEQHFWVCPAFLPFLYWKVINFTTRTYNIAIYPVGAGFSSSDHINNLCYKIIFIQTENWVFMGGKS